MNAPRLTKLVFDLRNGFWLRPLTLLVVGVAAGVAGSWLDMAVSERLRGVMSVVSPGGARALMSVFAGALATTLAISLSMTMVTVQLASSQYTPQLMRRYLGDRFTQRVVGAFLGTIAYTFMVLRAVHSPDEGRVFVPLLSLTVAAILTLCCFALLVVFMHRTMRSMQPSTIIAKLGQETALQIESLDARDLALPPPIRADARTYTLRATSAGYVQLVNEPVIAKVAGEHGAELVRRDARPGAFVVDGMPLLTVVGVVTVPDDLAERLRNCFVIGSERTQETDFEFGVRQLVDMALKALSPSINDTTTAVMVVNELAAIGRAVVRSAPTESPWRLRPELEGADFIAEVLTLDRYLELALTEVVLAAQTQPRVHVRALEILRILADGTDDPDAHRVLTRYEQRVRAVLAPSHDIDRSVAASERARIVAMTPRIAR